MSYQLTVIPKATYLHVTVTGDNTPENVSAYLEEVLKECVIRSRFRVLIEERLDGPRLDREAVLKIVQQGIEHALGFIDTIAYVDVNAEGDLMSLAGQVAADHQLPVRVFSNVAEAERWLQNRPGGMHL